MSIFNGWLMSALANARKSARPVKDADEACQVMFDAISADPEKNKVVCYGVDFTEQIRALLAIPKDDENYDRAFNQYISDVQRAMKN